MSRNNNNKDSYEDRKAIKSKSNKKKQQRKSKRHFDKQSLRGIMDGTVDMDAYQDYVNEEH